MTLTSGTRLGPYETQTAIGAGGMGEVYLARDPEYSWHLSRFYARLGDRESALDWLANAVERGFVNALFIETMDRSSRVSVPIRLAMGRTLPAARQMQLAEQLVAGTRALPGVRAAAAALVLVTAAASFLAARRAAQVDPLVALRAE